MRTPTLVASPRTPTAGRSRWVAAATALGPQIAEQAARHDAEGSFVADNYALLKAQRFLSAGVPTELGGGGASHAELCGMLRELGRYCGSTALALSMHTHLVAAAVWKYLHGKPAEALLRRVAGHELVLVSTGAADWVGSNGKLVRVAGGYEFSATKICCSGSPAGDVMITSGVYEGGEFGPEVMHFPVPLSAEGVTCLNDWDVLGMRGTGSHTWTLENVFVPEEAIALRRPQQGWHPAWSIVLTVAMPLIMSVYVGVTEAACEIVRDLARTRGGPFAPLGEMETRLVNAQIALQSLIDNAKHYAFEPSVERANAALVRKTLVARACLGAVDAAMEAGGGATFARRVGFERLFRDVQGCRFHPLAESKQVVFTGRHTLGLSPLA